MGILRKNLSAVVRPSRRLGTEIAAHEGQLIVTAQLFELDTTRTVRPSITRVLSALPAPPSGGDIMDWFHGRPSTPAGYAVRSGLLDSCSPVDLFEVEAELLAGGVLPHYVRVLSPVSDGAEDAAWCAQLGREVGWSTKQHHAAVEALAGAFRRTLSALFPDRAEVLRSAGAVLSITETLAEGVSGLIAVEVEFVADGPRDKTGPDQNLLGAPSPWCDLTRPCLLDRAVHIHLLGAVPLGEAMRQAIWEFRTAQAVRVLGMEASMLVSARFDADPGAVFADLATPILGVNRDV
jgi:hypothetical protein